MKVQNKFLNGLFFYLIVYHDNMLCLSCAIQEGLKRSQSGKIPTQHKVVLEVVEEMEWYRY